MVIAGICWVVVLAFGPKTMTQHQTADKPESADKVSPSTEEEKAKKDQAAEAENKPQPQGETSSQPEPVTETTADQNPVTPDPIVEDPPVYSPIIHYPLPKPDPPKFPPPCGRCGPMTQDNGLTIQCPMYEAFNSMVCIM